MESVTELLINLLQLKKEDRKERIKSKRALVFFALKAFLFLMI